MPRDLESEHQMLEGLTPLSRVDDRVGTDPPDVRSPPIIQSPEAMDAWSDDDEEEPHDLLQRNMHRQDKRNALHPFVSAMTTADVDACCIVEDACFPPDERCSKEKARPMAHLVALRPHANWTQFEYRLSTCGDVCLGIYTAAYTHLPSPSAGGTEAQDDDEYEPHSAQFSPSPALPSKDLNDNCPTSSTSHATSSGDGKPRKRMLLGHIISTRSLNNTIKDSDMQYPSDWSTNKAGDPSKGHQPFGTTICLHSLAILPQYKSLGLGKTLLFSYIDRMKGHGGIKRIALLAHDELVPFYESAGFENVGKSEATFGGGHWNDMLLGFPIPEQPPIQSLVDEGEGR